jgi:hypothetical protein
LRVTLTDGRFLGSISNRSSLRPRSEKAQPAASRTARGATPWPRCPGKTEYAIVATWSSRNCTLIKPIGWSVGPSAITCGAERPVRKASATRAMLAALASSSIGGSLSQRRVSGSWLAAQITSRSAARRYRRQTAPSLRGTAGGVVGFGRIGRVVSIDWPVPCQVLFVPLPAVSPGQNLEPDPQRRP